MQPLCNNRNLWKPKILNWFQEILFTPIFKSWLSRVFWAAQLQRVFKLWNGGKWHFFEMHFKSQGFWQLGFHSSVLSHLIFVCFNSENRTLVLCFFIRWGMTFNRQQLLHSIQGKSAWVAKIMRGLQFNIDCEYLSQGSGALGNSEMPKISFRFRKYSENRHRNRS